MNPSTPPHGAGRPPGGVAVLVLDGDGTVVRCTAAATALTGLPARELRGRPMTDLAADPGAWAGPLGGAAGELRELRTALLHRDGPAVAADVVVVPLPAGGRERFLVAAAAAAEHEAENLALVRALFDQEHIGLVLYGPDLLTRQGNLRPGLHGSSPGRSTGPPPGMGLADLLVPQDAAAIEERLARVLETGEPLNGWEHSARRLAAPGEERVLSLSAFRLRDPHGRVLGVAAVFTSITEQHTAQRRLALLYAAATRLGRTLDVTRNAEELAGVLVPGFADLASVDLSDAVSQGREVGRFVPGTVLRRTAVASADGTWPADAYQRGETVRAREVESEDLREGRAVLAPDLTARREALRPDAERLRLQFPAPASSALFVPLHARDNVLGVLGLWRTGEREPFAEEDVPLIEEIASRAALSLENARRYTTELRTVETLQRSLLPPADAEFSGAETAGAYVPASTAAGIGGCWYDVIRLSSTRVAFVIGDVAGHGLGATAAMGRLRTAVQTLADLDLPPEELLTHLDDLAVRLATTEPQTNDSGVVGTACLYCVYDPVTGECSMASAGHPPPVLTGPDGHVRRVDLRPGPVLGVGGAPFEPVRLRLGPGGVLVFCTAELVPRTGDGAGGRDRSPEEEVAAAVAAGGSPAAIGRTVLDRVLTGPPADDVALLVARVKALPGDATAFWQFAADPSVVGRARELATAQLAQWGLEEAAFTTELIVSELVTNAIRYAGPPIGLRLIRDKTLICEVSDPSQTQPHLRRARLTDEGGRGLFLIAQLARRWGSRPTPSGKTIWTEQPLEAAPETPPPPP